MKTTIIRSSLRSLVASLCGGLVLALAFGACAQKGKGTAQQQQTAQTMAKSSAGLLNPTVTTPTEIEGTWLAPCQSGNFGNGANSASRGYIFIGNSFYRQIDYYASTDCSWDDNKSLSQGRLYAKIAAGWFTISAASNGLKNIDLLAAPNFGSSYEFNVFSVSGSGLDRVLAMGDDTINGRVRPTATSINYTSWDTSVSGR